MSTRIIAACKFGTTLVGPHESRPSKSTPVSNRANLVAAGTPQRHSSRPNPGFLDLSLLGFLLALVCDAFFRRNRDGYREYWTTRFNRSFLDAFHIGEVDHRR